MRFNATYDRRKMLGSIMHLYFNHTDIHVLNKDSAKRQKVWGCDPEVPPCFSKWLLPHSTLFQKVILLRCVCSRILKSFFLVNCLSVSDFTILQHFCFMYLNLALLHDKYLQIFLISSVNMTHKRTKQELKHYIIHTHIQLCWLWKLVSTSHL